MANNCIFCDIIAGKSPASFIYQDKDTVVMMDIYPLNPGQVVVFSRKHLTNLLEADESTGMHLFLTAMRVCKALHSSGIVFDGINLFQSNGQAAGQDIFHLHVMVVPRLKNDSLKITANWQKPGRKELEEIATKLRSSFV